MDDTPPSDRPLRAGWTTGACACAAAVAAYTALVTRRFPDPVTIQLPKGLTPRFPLSQTELRDDWASAGIVKDAGDDPDVTHGAKIIARVMRRSGTGEPQFAAGPGVGTVTKPGLPIPVGEPAITPKPRAMILDNLARTARDLGQDWPAPLTITLSIPGGEKIAEKTMNGRLGIVGGLSILGTTGVVVPYSISAWIHSIHRAVDVALADGQTHLVASTGSTSEAAALARLGLPEIAAIEMGGHAGALFKYLRRARPERLTLAGGVGKMMKLGQGALDLHSGQSRVNSQQVAGWIDAAGGDGGAILGMESAATMLMQTVNIGVDLSDLISKKALETARQNLHSQTAVSVLVFDRGGKLLGQTDG
ncbi:MAG: cobalt-precorrin-5B (C(1))-methyltransferase [Magnetospiraceae bacterium]